MSQMKVKNIAAPAKPMTRSIQPLSMRGFYAVPVLTHQKEDA